MLVWECSGPTRCRLFIISALIRQRSLRFNRGFAWSLCETPSNAFHIHLGAPRPAERQLNVSLAEGNEANFINKATTLNCGWLSHGNIKALGSVVERDGYLVVMKWVEMKLPRTCLHILKTTRNNKLENKHSGGSDQTKSGLFGRFQATHCWWAWENVLGIHKVRRWNP